MRFVSSITDRLLFSVCVFESDYVQERVMVSFDCPSNKTIGSNSSVLWHDDSLESNSRQIAVMLNGVLNVPLSITTIIGNTVVIMSIWKNPSLHSPSNTILFGLAVCDFGVGFLVQPLYVIYQCFYIANQKQTWLILMKAFNILSNLLCGISFLTTVAVSVDRYLAIYLHLRYRELVTIPRAAFLLGALWLIAAFFVSTLIWNPAASLYAALSIIAFCIATTVGMYSKIFTVLQSHQRKICLQRTNQELRAPLQQRKSALNMFYVCFIHAICYLPYFVFLILRDGYATTNFTYLGTEFCQTLIFSNSCINPVIYCWRLREIRAAVKNTLQKFICCKWSRTAQNWRSKLTATAKREMAALASNATHPCT